MTRKTLSIEKTGAEIFIESLEKEGVEIIFGIPGGAVLPIFDKIYDSKKIKFILTRHEQGAAHMADGYARATGKVGVCIATSGPGATNLTTGIATAYMDSVPIVAFTGQVATHLVGNDAFQEADTTGITRPITKHNYLVKDVKDLAKIIREAFYIASTGRPGPVLIDIPVDIQRAKTEFIWPSKVDLLSYKPTYKGHPLQIKKLADAINNAKQPVLYVGGGAVISGASEELRELAETCHIPVTTTLMAIGVFPCDHELYLGMLGMHGTVYANLTMQNADLIIAVGARFDDRCTGKLASFAPKAEHIAHIDIDPTSISKNVTADIPVVGDCKLVLQDLLKLVKPKKHIEWLKQIKEWKEKYPMKYKNDEKLRPQYIIEEITKITKGDAIVVTEVGQNQMWAAQYYKPNGPRKFLSSGGLGTMGYGFPAGIGAKLGKPEEKVVVIAGDGSFQMNIQELATAVINKVNVIVCIMNNGYLGMVRQWQELFYNKRYSQTYLCTKKLGRVECEPVPDFVEVARAYKAEGYRVTKKDDVGSVLKKAFEIEDKPVIIDFWIEEEENVFPMVPAGAALDEVITSLA
ncbi:MAG: biosynthetic-type acetolactate synthase large subunit [Endomicrobia bacterium]|nr:biosynthetic-type acetolactate synthase large subunit [Endomicrobiia bacterium]MDW8056053.1 biosynthetic-type acetolactate synthase large subunit [Elusimicrobiota bacterium]